MTYTTEDADTVNADILQEYRENFEQAVIEGNFGLARDVIGDLRDAGFPGAARTLEKELVKVQNE